HDHIPHPRADQLGPGWHAPGDQVSVDPPVPIGLIGVGEGLADNQLELFTPQGSRRLGTIAPLIESRPRYLQQATHRPDRCGHHIERSLILRVLGVDEREPVAHRCSLAKYAEAFFKNSCSILISRFSRSSSRSRARSATDRSGSSPACSLLYSLTQFPKVCSTIPNSRATCAIGRDVSMTNFTASVLNSAE